MTGRRETADVCVAGGGPAGTALAIRLARLGFRTVLVERGRPPRGHRGETLSPGVWTQLDLLGARTAAERAGFAEFRRLRTLWEGAEALREFDGEPGMLIERASLAASLRGVARAEGVHVIEPATIGERSRDGESWRLGIKTDAENIVLEAAFLAIAGGRAAAAPNGRRRATGPRTLAVSSAWRGRGLPAEPTIEAGAEAWYWGMPLPDGSYGTTVFADPKRFRRDQHEALPAAFRRLLAWSRLLAFCRSAELVSPVEAAAATPYLDTIPADRHAIRVGEAALALDPLSSSGVQRAMQSALAAAAVVNTLLCRPSEAAAALQFYRSNLAAAADRHRRWATALYRGAAANRDTPFWRARAPEAGDPPAQAAAGRMPRPDLPISLAGEARFAATPCIVGDFVATRTALHHPRLDEPVAFVGGHELAPLLGGMRPGITAGELVTSWSGRIALRPALAIVGWMLETGVLVALPFHRHAEHAVRNPI